MRLLCARCRTERVDTALASFFLCDNCAIALAERAFNGAGPSFWDFGVASYCALCNAQKDLKLAQWFLCPYCERMVNSYRLGRVSQDHALAEWHRVVEPVASQIGIEPIDPVVLSPYVRPPRRRELAVTLDYRMIESGVQVAWIELKTGQRSIAEFATFQLDHSDCDDLLNVVRTTNLPAYVFHGQLDREYYPPGDRSVPRGLWWTDIFTMSEAYQRSERRRRNGGKMAAHFGPGCFRAIDSLGEALRDGHHRTLLARLRNDGPPPLYRS